MKKKPVSNHYIEAAIRGAVAQGVSVEQLLAQAEIPLQAYRQAQERICEEQLAGLIKAVWRETGDEFMGLTASPCKNGVFALMAESVLHTRTLGGMLQQSARFYSCVHSDLDLALTQRDDLADFKLTLKTKDLDTDHFFQEFLLLMWQRFSCWLVNEQLAFQSTYFNYPQPSHVAEYPPMFPGALVFNSTASGFTLPARLLAAPIVRKPHELAGFLRSSPLEVLRRVGQDTSIATRVKRHLVQCGVAQLPTLESVAQSLNMTSRTLRRKLKEEDVSFQRLKDQLRQDTAIRLLLDESLSIADISLLTGFTEQAAFCRAFKSWTGVPPSSYHTAQTR
ncbi:AraC family transcriptional regulator [Neptunomonas sp. XY-337]|uniref:AraC family transcriptional regulator n=1 Tax=Neptunomonas sp. XY-337 TaxID=2561897 RepID=UPI0010AA0A45|nr:AraC family transcriptional regulator [Neptunomonas sp. XY-337]